MRPVLNGLMIRLCEDVNLVVPRLRLYVTMKVNSLLLVVPALMQIICFKRRLTVVRW